MTATTIFDLYRGRLNVWVEDDMTRVILTELWRDRMLHVISAGGSEAVRYMVRAAASNPSLKDLVFGVVDRDHEDDGPDWSLPNTTTFVLPVHEIENLLLDFEVLGALADRPPGELRAMARAYVREQRWWAVGKMILRELRRAMTSDFPTDPPEGLRDAGSVAAWLEKQPYWVTHAGHFSAWNGTEYRRGKIDELGVVIGQDFESDAWLSRFPGKEILRYLRTHVAGLDRAPPRGRPTPAVRDMDLAKRITRRMIEEERVPGPLVELRKHLNRKAAGPRK
ncbi:DUF4435 domain-containing protein [Nannocystis sp.]|uniref:DUF4435 domain-containing protein n=1 Tax=Nannocystis sp. TaxID=1962667 RepID=UPI002427C3BD|nr:DUF4435 domain-containing protein [Nannocystis sp.]MBK7830645.1 DUF4435 domain-containing protein [Nannocystis sp.]MBK9756176.1 DUF4435 domain-containing protein [Nannocystis sp.]